MSFKKLVIVAKFGDQLNREENKSRWPKKDDALSAFHFRKFCRSTN